MHGMFGIAPATLAAYVVVYLLAMNVIATVVFGLDKLRARAGVQRVPERVLLLLAVFGGSVGALAGMHLFRHKTRKPLFSRGVPIILVAQIALAAWLAYAFVAPRFFGPPQPELQEAKVDYVVDGDTIDVVVDGAEQRVRLAGIDAPESVSHDASANSAEGEQAAEFARSLLPIGRRVLLQKDVSDTDRYGRLVRYVWLQEPADAYDAAEVSSKMANAIIVESGYARAYRYHPDTAYHEHFEAAQQRAADADAGVSYFWRS
ncbi:MAG TPA: hypothetical protein DCP91_11070 [Eggerthellaceae bacterium]|nr:hypothetical protein [Eggerthellaceae bacterium]